LAFHNVLLKFGYYVCQKPFFGAFLFTFIILTMMLKQEEEEKASVNAIEIGFGQVMVFPVSFITDGECSRKTLEYFKGNF